MQDALEYRIDYLDNTAENLEDAESRITDADMAKEIMEYTKQNILYQCCQQMFIQANRKQEGIIELLKSL
jgi:flagellin